MAYAIAEPCIDVKDKACVEVCPSAGAGLDHSAFPPRGSIVSGRQM
jgi:NAD-dependent dihydropyrimidine dehydrogenase PreA subunit